MSMYPDQVRNTPLDYSSEREFPLFKFFNQVYAWMFVGLAVTGLVAFFVSQTPAIYMIFKVKGIGLIFMLGLVGLAYATQAAAMRISAGLGLALFLLYATGIGVAISYIFIIYPAQTIVASFVVTGGVFGGMSLFGFVTKRDLTSIGAFCIMCVWGLFLASIVNYFVAGSNVFSWMITYAVLAVFIVLTAYDTQKLKEIAQQHAHDPALLNRAAVVGSLQLYLDFINIFLSILRILGNRK